MLPSAVSPYLTFQSRWSNFANLFTFKVWVCRNNT